jgi:preprotein translocase subunit SecF
MIKWMKYRYIYFLISGLVIGSGIFGLIKWGLKIGVDFTGGAVLEYKINKDISTESLTKEIEKTNVVVVSAQKAQSDYTFKLSPISQDQRSAIKTTLEKYTGTTIEELSFQNVGPAVGPELVKKTVYALIISASAILLWIAIQFKSFKFGISAVLAMFHDSLVVIGTYALFDHFFGAEVDFLFITALLTILSFSVHDTIIVYDRIRESRKGFTGTLTELANKAVSETMVRSLNNTFTEIFMLTALVLLGGTTIKWFAVALLVGMTSGAYSSPFVAVPILVTWDELEKKIKAKGSLLKFLKLSK